MLKSTFLLSCENEQERGKAESLVQVQPVGTEVIGNSGWLWPLLREEYRNILRVVI
jgi:hypothetical protein